MLTWGKFIIKQRSGKENFTIIPPEIEDARGSETGTVLVNGVHAVGDTTIAMDAFAGDGAGRFKTGDFIKFASLISKNSNTQIIIVKNEEELNKFLKKNLISDEIIIGMGAGVISKWMKGLKYSL